MFNAERWAAAFIKVLDDGGPDMSGAASGKSGGDLGKAGSRSLAALKALAVPAGRIPGKKSGFATAAQLNRMIQRAFDQCGPVEKETEIARRFLLLMVKRNVLRHIELITREIENLLDKKAKILRITAESALPMDDGFWEQLKEPIKRKTGAGDIRFIIRTVPELLSGYRLLTGGESLDASLRGQLQKMAEDLALPPGGF
ncbi:MAG: F0F1 ATP synthase subunit delta [Treponema sp.]|jgi:F0F1-type ATP synthase delta subunit|nr:F0F1 ATP synthase subunit delta [Treponema sp.]